ncbi:MAG: hypothetical protein MJ175_01660 [Clostridia bacterium]|nr:hypothetical protein [Clostridia bacterium]
MLLRVVFEILTAAAVILGWYRLCTDTGRRSRFFCRYPVYEDRVVELTDVRDAEYRLRTEVSAMRRGDRLTVIIPAGDDALHAVALRFAAQYPNLEIIIE